MKSTATVYIASLATVLALCLPFNLTGSTRGVALKSIESSHARSVIIGFHVRFLSGGENKYQPDKWDNMRAILYAMAQVDLHETDLFIHQADQPLLKNPPSQIFAYYQDQAPHLVFLHEILSYPIAYSFAVYEDVKMHPPERVPLLWTRDLHKYKSFDAPYSGHIAFMDGHVIAFNGKPEQHDEELEYWFGDESPVVEALKIVSHVPDDWEESIPLPIRFEALSRQKIERAKYKGILGYLTLPTLVGLITAFLGNKSRLERIVTGAIAFSLVALLLAILIP